MSQIAFRGMVGREARSAGPAKRGFPAERGFVPAARNKNQASGSVVAAGREEGRRQNQWG
jgi:hypothetical protein